MAVLFASYPPRIFPYLSLCKINFAGSAPRATSLLLQAAAGASPALGPTGAFCTGYRGAADGCLIPAAFHAQRDASDLPRVYSGAGEEECSRAATPTQTPQ